MTVLDNTRHSQSPCSHDGEKRPFAQPDIAEKFFKLFPFKVVFSSRWTTNFFDICSKVFEHKGISKGLSINIFCFLNKIRDTSFRLFITQNDRKTCKFIQISDCRLSLFLRRNIHC